MPRARPQLAALTPPDDLKLAPDDNAITSRTAIYDITAKTVHMPNGERLEAHSGFGEHMDDPKYVRVRMRGVTPPNVYKLTMREALFHGVEAIRMNPEDKAAMIEFFTRNGQSPDGRPAFVWQPISERPKYSFIPLIVGTFKATVVAMLVAAFGYLPPLQGALLQEAIDVAVILNALRALKG